MDKTPLHVLIVEDNPADAELVLRELRRAGFEPDRQRVDTEAEFSAKLDPKIDIILSDYAMPQFNGLHALELLKKRGLEIPFILISGTIGEETAVEAMRSGATDYLLKDRLARLGQAVQQALEQRRLRDEGKRAEEAMRQSEHKYRHLFESLSEAAFLIDAKSRRILDANLSAEKLLGRTRTEILGMNEAKLFQPSEAARYCGKLASAGTGGKGELYEAEIQSKNGKAIQVRMSLAPVELYGRDLVLALMADVTEQKKLETQLMRTQRLESIGTLASGVAHDLNNILTPILVCAQALHGALDDEDRQSALALIEESAHRGASVVKQVLTFARGVEGERVLIKPSHLVHEMVDIARRTFPKSIEITARYPEDLSSIKGDPTQLHQVLLNISVNARDAMPAGGKLVFAAENLNVDEHYAAMTPGATPGPYVLLQIRDTGSGMPQETLDKIFDPFFTTKELGKGTGLGLSTALGIVKSHGGFMSVSSEVAKGTIFKIFLPAEVSDQRLVSSETRVAAARGHGELVLVVDDEENIRRATKTVLEQHNYRVVSANDGVEALALFAQQMQDIRVVLTDISMPLLDGVAEVRALRKMNPNVPIIAFTGEDQRARLNELEAMNVNNFLIKPFNAETLLAAVHSSVGTSNEAS